MSFSEFGLSDSLLKSIAELAYSIPTPIQKQAIPLVLGGSNVIAAADTGTGKTASFVLPILQRLDGRETVRAKRVRALILTPTRELAMQVEDAVGRYGKFTGVRSAVMVGGVDPEPQKQALIDGVDILVATPGRLRDMMTQRAVHFDELEMFVLDEADKMLDMGFIGDINKVIDHLPDERQNLLFSATLSPQVRALAKTAMTDAVEISVVGSAEGKPDIEEWMIVVDKDAKSALLSHLIKTQNWQQGLIFIETKHGAAKLVSQLAKRDIHADAIHSGRSQVSRNQVLENFQSGDLPFLVATGIAARGLDVEGLDRVINYDLPFDTDEYIHRIGRTGRAGNSGEAVSFLSRDDFTNLCAIETRIDHIIERRLIDGFVPKKEVPVSVLNYVPKNKRSSKKKQDKSKGYHSESDGYTSAPRKKRVGPLDAGTNSNRNTEPASSPNRVNPWANSLSKVKKSD